MVRNLTNIWETFCNQILSHGPGRLIPGQVEILDMPLQVLSFGLGLISKDSLDLLIVIQETFSLVASSCT